MLFFGLIATALAGELVEQGESFQDATHLSTQVHAEFIGYRFALMDQTELLVELQAAENAGSGACSFRGHTLSPRWELLKMDVTREEQPAFITVLCSRLEDTSTLLPTFEERVIPSKPTTLSEKMKGKENRKTRGAAVFAIIFIVGLLVIGLQHWRRNRLTGSE